MPFKITSSIIFLVYSSFFSNCLNFSGKSYYFKTVGNNEFAVHNRIHYLNHNITDYEVNPHTSVHPGTIKSTKKVTSPKVFKDPQKTTETSNFYLDKEWDYDRKPPNKTDLPFFIKKLYEQRTRETNKTDTVRILFNTNRNTSSRIIKFNLDSLKAHENVTDADLYFYWPLDNSSGIYKTSVVLRLYQFEKQFDNGLNESNLVENPDIHKLFNVIYISKAQKGWQTFKIKKPIDNWTKGEKNLGLLLTISSYDDNKLISIFNDTNRGAFRTFAVLNIAKNEAHIHTNVTGTTDISMATTTMTQKCSRKPWQVDFEQFHWDTFILYPENGFMAYQCSGKCNLDEKHQINHVKLRIPNGHGFREKSCCVPTRLSSLPIMFFDEHENVAVKNYEDMVVSECGCR